MIYKLLVCSLITYFSVGHAAGAKPVSPDSYINLPKVVRKALEGVAIAAGFKLKESPAPLQNFSVPAYPSRKEEGPVAAAQKIIKKTSNGQNTNWELAIQSSPRQRWLLEQAEMWAYRVRRTVKLQHARGIFGSAWQQIKEKRDAYNNTKNLSGGVSHQ